MATPTLTARGDEREIRDRCRPRKRPPKEASPSDPKWLDGYMQSRSHRGQGISSIGGLGGRRENLLELVSEPEDQKCLALWYGATRTPKFTELGRVTRLGRRKAETRVKRGEKEIKSKLNAGIDYVLWVMGRMLAENITTHRWATETNAGRYQRIDINFAGDMCVASIVLTETNNPPRLQLVGTVNADIFDCRIFVNDATCGKARYPMIPIERSATSST